MLGAPATRTKGRGTLHTDRHDRLCRMQNAEKGSWTGTSRSHWISEVDVLMDRRTRTDYGYLQAPCTEQVRVIQGKTSLSTLLP